MIWNVVFRVENDATGVALENREHRLVLVRRTLLHRATAIPTGWVFEHGIDRLTHDSRAPYRQGLCSAIYGFALQSVGRNALSQRANTAGLATGKRARFRVEAMTRIEMGSALRNTPQTIAREHFSAAAERLTSPPAIVLYIRHPK